MGSEEIRRNEARALADTITKMNKSTAKALDEKLESEPQIHPMSNPDTTNYEALQKINQNEDCEITWLRKVIEQMKGSTGRIPRGGWSNITEEYQKRTGRYVTKSNLQQKFYRITKNLKRHETSEEGSFKKGINKQTNINDLENIGNLIAKGDILKDNLNQTSSKNTKEERINEEQKTEVQVESTKKDIETQDAIKRVRKTAAKPNNRLRLRHTNRGSEYNITEDETENIKSSQLYITLKRTFDEEYKKNCKRPISDWEKTRKIPWRYIKSDVIDKLNMIVKDKISGLSDLPIIEIITIIYTCQVVYEKHNFKKGHPSEWLARMERDINALEDKINFINKYAERKTRDYTINKILKKMVRNSGNKGTSSEVLLIVKQKMWNKTMVKKDQIKRHKERVEYRKTNNEFELYRKRFYRRCEKEITGNICEENTDLTEDQEKRIFTEWSAIWNNNKTVNNIEELHNFSCTRVETKLNMKIATIKFLIMKLPNWKAAGADKIYNYFIKHLNSLHDVLGRCIIKLLHDPASIPSEMRKGLTYLIPKYNDGRVVGYRPITCLSNVMKLYTKTACFIMRDYIEQYEIVSENQLGNRRFIEGAKEQVLLNKNIMKSGKNIKVVWIDLKKAFDSVNHELLIRSVEKLGFPKYIVAIVEHVCCSMSTELMINGKNLGELKLSNGLLQGDSLSPLLFTLVMELLTKKLNKQRDKVELVCEQQSFSTNHLLFIDDIKLMATTDEALIELVKATETFFDNAQMTINAMKSGSSIANIYCNNEKLMLLTSYKYLGIYENHKDVLTRNNVDAIISKVETRIEVLSRKKLNSRNYVKAINEWVVALMNYFIGILDFSEHSYRKLDLVIRKSLYKNKTASKTGSVERLYLPREDCGRGVKSIVHRSEKMLLKMNTDFKNSCMTRRKFIMANEKNRGSMLANIDALLKTKYNLNVDELKHITRLEERQIKELKTTIDEKVIHGLFFKDWENMDRLRSSTWIVCGMTNPFQESLWMNMQDRNLFQQRIKCRWCNSSKKSMDHIATRCIKGYQRRYKERHAEVLKVIHSNLMNKFNIKIVKRIRNYQTESVVENDDVRIICEMPFVMEKIIKHNKPDLIIINKRQRMVTIVEVGITNKDILRRVEVEKRNKYEELATEIGRLLKYRVEIIPFVISWDGCVTNKNKGHCRHIKMDDRLFGYVQTIVLKETYKCIVDDNLEQMESESNVCDYDEEDLAAINKEF